MAAAYRAMADGHTTRGPADDFAAYCERQADHADRHAHETEAVETARGR